MQGTQKAFLLGKGGAWRGCGGARAGLGQGRPILFFGQSTEEHAANIPAAFGFPFLSVLRLN